MARSSESTASGAKAGPPPSLMALEEAKWGPAPAEVFPAGAEMSVIHGDPSVAGEVFTVRIRVPRGYFFAAHCHPHDEHLTVLSGRLQLGNGTTAERSSARVLESGGYAFAPKEKYHYAWALDDGTVFQVSAVGPFGITYACEHGPEDTTH